MRAASRLFAAVKPGQYLEAGTPTGLTGLLTHASPRSTLLYLYSSTLDKLAQIPESSVYRQSTEAVTKHRFAVVEGVKPPGHDAWAEKVQYAYGENPDAFQAAETARGMMIETASKEEVDPREASAAWDGESRLPTLEGIRSPRERRVQMKQLGGGSTFKPERIFKKPTLDAEPQLTAEQISDIESRIGAGLIEEVIQVAEGEHKLVDEMIKSKPWEPLEEPAPEGQWSYFERGGHTKTQKP